ncbi:hypothetical protein [Nonomuraea sp. NPDC050643]|uniref:hypothetical protein n=1 Tax=Nonomuraea sp. NPDC050643 TaxID=3155660 RepID=UPI0033C9B643
MSKDDTLRIRRETYKAYTHHRGREGVRRVPAERPCELLRPLLTLLLATTLAACTATPPAAAPTPTAATVSPAPAAVVPDRLRPITGPQVCAAVPKTLQSSLLSDDMLSDEIGWRNNVATATEIWGECEWYVGAPHALTVTVQAYGTVTQTATDHAKQSFEKSKADAAKLAVEPDGLGWVYTPPAAADHGDAAFSLTGTRDGKTRRSRSRYTHMVIRQGPWLITIRYRGEELDGELPTAAELRRGTDQVAEVFTAEMAKDPGTVAPEDSGLCGTISAADVSSAFFPSVTEVGSSGDADDTFCTWKIRDRVSSTDEVVVQTGGYCGRGLLQIGDTVPRCGELRIHVDDVGHRERRALRTEFDAKTERYAKDAPVKRLTGIGDRAFAVTDQVHVLAGGHLIQLSYDGSNTGGGVRDAPGYQEPDLDEAALRKSLIRTAATFVSGLS